MEEIFSSETLGSLRATRWYNPGHGVQDIAYFVTYKDNIAEEKDLSSF
jgi:hypothetical protein